jgi:hypothetical protein
MIYSLDGGYGIRWETKIPKDTVEFLVTDSVEGIGEVYIEGIQVLIWSGSIFERAHESLQLTGCAASRAKAFLAIAQNAVVFGKIREDESDKSGPGFIDCHMEADWSFVIKVHELASLM